MKDTEVTLMSFGLTQLLHLLVALEIMSSSQLWLFRVQFMVNVVLASNQHIWPSCELGNVLLVALFLYDSLWFQLFALWYTANVVTVALSFWIWVVLCCYDGCESFNDFIFIHIHHICGFISFSNQITVFAVSYCCM